jgi:hypothetical protein
MRLDSSFRWNDKDSTSVIPGEQRETRNPSAYSRGKGVLFLSRSVSDEAIPVRDKQVLERRSGEMVFL